MNKNHGKHLTIILILIAMFFAQITIQLEPVNAGSYSGLDLAQAILANQSTLISSSYWDRDQIGHRQSIVLSELGTMRPTNGQTFAFLSTGIAGAPIITTGATNPGDERGTYFRSKYGNPRDEAELTLVLKVPANLHYLYYDYQFFSAEYPEYLGSQYNDKFTVTVISPSKGPTTHICDVESGDFVMNSNYISGTGFDIFATSGNPVEVDWVSTTPISGADAGATAIITRGGTHHPVSPLETITVKFDIKDEGDNQFDSAVFIDNLLFTGYAETNITAMKTVTDLNGAPYECFDNLKYTITISNSGSIDQGDYAGNEFEDLIPENTTYVSDSITATSGTIAYDEINNKITWNGPVLKDSSVILTYQVKINQNLANGTIISNQGTVYWDKNEDHINEATKLTDDTYVDDGIDTDGNGVTGDDDPTKIIITGFIPPSQVTEDFSDNVEGGAAIQSYLGRKWFETNSEGPSSDFHVVSTYKYSTDNAFKTQIRAIGGSQYWDYTLPQLNSYIKSWEVMLKCGNASEAYDLYLNFKNIDNNDIAKIKFEYEHAGTKLPTDWVLKLYFWSPIYNGWERLETNYTGGYLCNGWYKLKIEKNDPGKIKYSLYKLDKLLEFKIDNELSSPFTNLAKIQWTSTKNPVACPMFFWDEHKLGLT